MGDFIGSVKSALEPGSFLVSTDLTKYYEGVNLARLKSELLSLLPQIGASAAEKYQMRQVIEDLFRCPVNWTFDKERGLPQNRDASSFLANIYMHLTLPSESVARRRTGFGLSSGSGCALAVRLRRRVVERWLVARTEPG